MAEYVTVKHFEVKGDLAYQTGERIIRRDSLVYRVSVCKLRFDKTKNRYPLFLYFDDTSKQLVATDTAGRDLLAPENMVNIDSFQIVPSPIIGSAQKQCESIQVRLGALTNNFVLTRAVKYKLRDNLDRQVKDFYELYHDGVRVGVTNQAGYNAITNPAVLA